jgi:hypothetical protein
MTGLGGLSPAFARNILDRVGSTGQPPERGALLVNVGTDGLLEVIRDEYLRPMKVSKRNSTFKLVQAPFGGGKTQFLHALRELAWAEGFVTTLVGLSPKECPFDRPVEIYREIARRIELPVEELDEEPSQGLEVILQQIATMRIEENGADAFRLWLKDDSRLANVESRAFGRAVRHFLEAICNADLDTAELLGDYLRGDAVSLQEVERFRLRERLEDDNAFRWIRSLAQTLSALDCPGLVLMFDEMDRNMSLSVGRRRAIGDNLRQMIDYCGQALLPGVVWCYAVPPEFMTTIVPEYPALAQRLKGAVAFSKASPLQPIIDLDRLPIGPTELLTKIGLRLLDLSERAWPETRFDRKSQEANVQALATTLGGQQLESGTRRQFVKAVVSMLDEQRRDVQRVLADTEIAKLAGAAKDVGPELMPGEQEF